MKPNPQPMTLKRPMLETTKADMAKAPRVKEDQFSAKKRVRQGECTGRCLLVSASTEMSSHPNV
ncbi:hypothetical protein [Pusillimonas sp. ANT_WB101]|uniref:hypothetical protein n=1 Tax=Pusillimonas sp. ANT_WB101 TaxID=2597356 RepID=UPI0011ED79A5|nr:hypothetical protein [Pusillimonas sp. ANT_WB101]KAA0889343.1 hypothetical protein FQ179_19435 [Pusillimonas sp. ANT_WB101]